MSRVRPFIAVYMMSNGVRGAIYIGVTSDLPDRIYKHREGAFEGFTKRYGLKNLVWFEPHLDMITAIQRERSLKRWPRHWKINLIERDNPDWADLYPSVM
jgi:putative endonuclease